MLETPTHPLLSEIEVFRARHGMSKSRFGEGALGDPRLVFDLEKGRELRRSTEGKVRRWMASFSSPSTPDLPPKD